jgi:signal transduction histidine kinase
VATQKIGNSIEITIGDNGAGIAPDVLPRIFEPLFSTKSFGTGLGLPTVKQIVEQHGGEIELTSELGVGTRARVRLPLPRSEEIAA